MNTDTFHSLDPNETKKKKKKRILRNALIDGEQSGWADEFDPEKFKAKMQAKKAL